MTDRRPSLFENITIATAALSALVLFKEAFFQFVGSKNERQVDRVIEAFVEEQRTLNAHIAILVDRLGRGS
jgi:hypothetical protein